MFIFRCILLVVLTAGLLACDEHTALNATVEVAVPPAAITPTTVELILAGAEVIAPDGQRSDPANSGTLLRANIQKVGLKVCKGTPYATVTQTLETLQARGVSVAVADANPASCGR